MNRPRLRSPADDKYAMSAETIAKALGGRKAGGGWLARCAAHDDGEPSLSMRNGGAWRVLVHCHVGCEQERVIAVLHSRGLWEDNGYRRLTRPPLRIAANDRPDQDDAKRSEAALAIWHCAAPAYGTPVETYFVARGLRVPPPPTLRFHAGLKHPSGGIWPGMIAVITRGGDDMPLAIHRTFLARDGSGKAPIDPQKMMLGPRRCGAARRVRRHADGRRRHRDLPRGHAGDRTSRLGGALYVWPSSSPSAGRSPRGDRARGWGRSRRGGGA